MAAHPWDLAGAAHAGLHTAWVRHGASGWPRVFPVPSYRADTLLETADQIIAGNGIELIDEDRGSGLATG